MDLISAVSVGDMREIERILDRGVPNLNLVVGTQTALIGAVCGGDQEIISLLLDQGADVNFVTDSACDYGAALITAVCMENSTIVSLLLDRGADVNLVAVNNWSYGTALIAAVSKKHEEIVSLLLDRGADVNLVAVNNWSYATALIAAVYEEHEGMVSLLLDRGAYVNLVAVSNWPYGTALIAAVSKKHEGMVSLLLDRGADVNLMAVSNWSCATALIAAVSEEHEGIVSLLLDRGADVNLVAVSASKYRTALIAAVCMKNSTIVSLLLDRGADVNLVAVSNWPYGTALIAAVSKKHEGMVSLLLDRGADVNLVAASAPKYRTALIAAICMENSTIVSLLLDRGADVNLVAAGAPKYRTALIAAVCMKNSTIVSLLLDRGADVNLVAVSASKYRTALIAAVCMKNSTIVSLLLDRGADVNLVAASAPKYRTALIAAICMENSTIVSLLLDRGADVNLVAAGAPKYRTALIAAVCMENSTIVSLLLDRGADVNLVAVNSNYETALIAAICKKHKGIVSLLLDRGADVNLVVVNSDYGTALIAAVFQENTTIVSLLLDRGADVNLVAVNSDYETALIAAVFQENTTIVSLLLDRGADVNLVAVNSDYETALIAAVCKKNSTIVSLLLDLGADVNLVAVNSNYGTALIAAVCNKHEGIVSLLLDRGADVNMVAANLIYETALIAAVCKKHEGIVSLLLDRGADVNLVAVNSNYGTALIAAVCMGNSIIVSLLLDRGADVNLVVTVNSNYGTALIAAACMRNSIIVSLLDRGADVNMVATNSKYGTALIAAAFQGCKWILDLLLEPSRGVDVNLVGGEYGTALIAAVTKGDVSIDMVLRLQAGEDLTEEEVTSRLQDSRLTKMYEDIILLLLARGADVTILGGKYGSALIAAIVSGWDVLDVSSLRWNWGGNFEKYISQNQFLPLLVNEGVDINAVGDDRFGNALGAAVQMWPLLQTRGPYELLKLLLDNGADINAVGCQHGSALGIAAHMGKKPVVEFLLQRGADPFHVGGYYHNAECKYPTALDAAKFGKGGPDLIGGLESIMGAGETNIPWAPFPMRYTVSWAPAQRTTVLYPTHFTDPDTCNLPAGASLTPDQGDLPCRSINEEILIKLLRVLIGVRGKAAKHRDPWIRGDVRYFLTHDYDLGLAYAAARVGWCQFNNLIFNVAAHRYHWHKRAIDLNETRINSIYQDSTGQELIKSPYEVMPRYIWDLKSNRVVEFKMLHSALLARVDIRDEPNPGNSLPVYWAITHSWTSGMEQHTVETPINQYQWPVPLPEDLDLERDLRVELLDFGTLYVWLDVLCLRQQSTIAALNSIKEAEWKLDVPTIGNIYRSAEGLVRYFNGLGRPFSSQGWENDRHWLRRAWTLQEIRTENITINGGMSSDGTSSRIMKTEGEVAGRVTTLRQAIRPILKLASEVDSPSGCCVYDLAREMSKRFSTKPTDKVAGLLYLLRTTQLPTYNEDVSDEEAWARCFHVLPFGRKIELLFDFPYPGSGMKLQWFPTWEQLMAWPECDPEYDYVPAECRPNLLELPQLQYGGLEAMTDETSFFVSDIWAISQVHLDATDVANEYEIKLKNKVFGFYFPYQTQNHIYTPGTQLFTLAIPQLGHSYNWVVCELMGKEHVQAIHWSGNKKGKLQRAEIEILRKVLVLRTDSCGELRMGGREGDSALKKINAVFL